jgi:type VI secretion system protein ImpF
MARSPRSSAEVLVTLSVFDRLIDRDPKNPSGEEPMTRAQSVRELKAAVRRDLEWILNSRRIVLPPDAALTELNKSVYVFGLSDFTGWSLNSNRDQIRLLRSVHQTIKVFEPRLGNVNIIPIESQTISTRTMRFRIEAMLLMDPAPEQVSFDTLLDLTSAKYQLQGDPNAG